MFSNLILYQPVTRGAFLAAGPGPIVEIVLLAAVTAISHEAFPAFTAAVIFALERERPLRVTVAGFAAFRSKPEVVDLAALTVLAGDARLALALATADVALPIGGTQSVAVTPLTALPALQVVEPRVTGSTVPAGHVRQTFTLPSHGVTVTLLLRGPVGIAITGFALVCRIGGQGVSEKSASAPVTVDAGRVVDALQTLSRHAVAVSDGVGVDVVVALAQAAEPHGAVSAQRVPKVAIVTELAPLAGRARGTVGAHHLLRLGDDGTTGAAGARTGLAIGGGAQGRVSVVPVRAPLALRAGCVVSAVTNTCLGVAGLAVPAAGAQHTRTVRPETRRLSPVAREARLAELPSVPRGTGAGLHPRCGDPRPRTSTCQGDIVQVSGTSLAIGPTDLDRGQIVKELLKFERGQRRSPRVICRFVEPEDVLRSGLTRIGVALSNQGYGHSEASALQQHVFCREASVSPVHAKGEGEVLTITPHLLAQELRRSDEVPRKVAV